MKILFFILYLLFAFPPVISECICAAEYSPVCATSGKTYSNRCQLLCAHATFKHSGACGRYLRHCCNSVRLALERRINSFI